MSFERVGSETKWEGRIATVRVERFRHDDGEEVEREVVGHPGAVGVVAYDDAQVWLVRQPREPAGEPALLEVPAGKLDVEDEPPLETAKRELAEEIGKQAAEWEDLGSFYSSAGFSDEEVFLFLDGKGQVNIEEVEPATLAALTTAPVATIRRGDSLCIAIFLLSTEQVNR